MTTQFGRLVTNLQILFHIRQMLHSMGRKKIAPFFWRGVGITIQVGLYLRVEESILLIRRFQKNLL